MKESTIKNLIVSPEYISNLNQEISGLEEQESLLQLIITNNPGPNSQTELIAVQSSLSDKEKELLEI